MSHAFRVRWSTAALAALALVLSLLYYTWTWSTELGDFGGDNAVYLLTARHFSLWSSSSPAARYFATHSPYPPLYPLVLAIFGGAENLWVAHIITTTTLLLAFYVLYLWVRRLEIAPALAALFTLLFALFPGTYMNALGVLSENLYLLTTLLALLGVARFEYSRDPVWLWVAAASIIGATLTRSAGVSLTAAFVLYLALNRPVQYRYLALSVVSAGLLWQWFGPHAGSSYVDFLVAQYGAVPLQALPHLLARQARVLWAGWVGNLTSSPVGFWVAGAAGILCLTGTVLRILRRRFDGLYAASYLTLLLVWPFPAEAQRFVMVIVPILLVHGVLLLNLLPRIKVGAADCPPAAVMLLALTLVCMPTLLLTAQRFMQPLPKELASFRRTAAWYAPDSRTALAEIEDDKAMVDHLRSVAAIVPEQECVYSIKPSILGYYAGRISLIPPRPNFSQAGFDEYLRRTGCRFFYLAGFASPSFHLPYYPIQRLPKSLTMISAAPSRSDTAPVGILAVYSAK